MKWRKPRKQGNPRSWRSRLSYRLRKNYLARLQASAEQAERRLAHVQDLNDKADEWLLIATKNNTDQSAPFCAYVQADKHRLGKLSFKPYKRIAVEVLDGDGSLDFVARRLMEIHFPEIAENITTANAKRQARTRRKKTYDEDGWRIPPPSPPKQRQFLEYVRQKKHRKGSVGIKSFAEIGRDLNTSAKSIGKWMWRHFPTLYAKRRRLS